MVVDVNGVMILKDVLSEEGWRYAPRFNYGRELFRDELDYD